MLRKTFGIFVAIALSAARSSAYYHDQISPDVTYFQKNTVAHYEIGTGYATDTGQLAENACYNAKSVNENPLDQTFRFSETYSVTKLASELRLDGQYKLGYSIFQSEGLLHYLSTIEENEVAMSYSYYYKVSKTYTIKYPRNILNEDGVYYYNDGKSPSFRVICGDKLVAEYEKGAVLIMTMQLKFKDTASKETFQAKISAGLKDIASASAEIQKIVSIYNIQGSVEITGKQVGGREVGLAEVFAQYPTNCNIQSFQNCRAAMDSVLRYANTTFKDQLNNAKEDPYVFYGVFEAKASVDRDHDDIELADSYVTPDVFASREKLESTYQRNLLLQEQIKLILTNYPVIDKLDSEFKTQAFDALNNITDNLKLFKQTANPSPLDCWNEPKKCTKIATTIQSRIKPVNININNLCQKVLKNNDPGSRFNGGEFWPTGNLYRKAYAENTPPSERNQRYYWIDSSSAELTLGSLTSLFSAQGREQYYSDYRKNTYIGDYAISKSTISGTTWSGTINSYEYESWSGPLFQYTFSGSAIDNPYCFRSLRQLLVADDDQLHQETAQQFLQ